MKINSQKIIKELKDKEKEEMKTNFTFRLNNQLTDKFKEKCKKDKISTGKVIEKLIQCYLEN